MKRQGIPMLLITALAIFGWNSPAAAQDFTFNVPVELYDLHPDVTAFRVTCTVYESMSTVHQGRVTLPLDTNHGYQGLPVAVRISLETATEDELLAVNRYECGLSLLQNESDPSGDMPFEGHSAVYGRPMAGTTFVNVVAGLINP